MKAAAKENNHWGRAARVFRRCATTSMVATIVLALLWGSVLAAEQATTENADAPPKYEVPEDEFGRGSPRGTVKGYLAACREGDYEKAANYLDLRRIPGDGPTLARQLQIILSRTLWVDVDVLSQEHAGRSNDGLPPYRDRLGTINKKAGKVDILLQSVPREDGVTIWKIAGVTVAQVPDLYNEFGYGGLEHFLPKIFFELQFLDIALWQWIGLLVLVLLAAVVSWFLTVFVVRLLGTVVAFTKTTIDDKMRVEAAGPIRLAIAVLLFRTGLVPLGLGVKATEFISSLLSALFIVAVTWLLLRVTNVLSSVVEERLVGRGEVGAMGLVPPGRKFVKAIVVIFAFVAILSNFGFNVAALLAGLGVGGIAVALAAQRTIENLFGGIVLYTDQPVRVGDFCRFGDKLGTIEEIGIRSTRIRTLDHTVITVPNAKFSNMELDNITARERIRLLAVVTVRYETTPDQLRYILVEIRKLLYSHERVISDTPRVRFINFGAYSLDIEVVTYINTTDWAEFLGIREDIFLRIMDIIKASGTGFAFPSQTLYMGKDDGLKAERVQEISEKVQQWREHNEIYLPNFPADKIEEFKGTLLYPPAGSPEHRGTDS
ncbi:MAG: mechanosensitive ion channel family protein [Deltaproteobacteria bacterium]|nr:mechanosensitive ion channel family protein [Deltaproteobacteria bacterium]